MTPVAQAMQEAWQPIESVPCDGSNVWLYNARKGRMTQSFWSLSLGRWWDVPLREKFTHWQPIETPPPKE